MAVLSAPACVCGCQDPRGSAAHPVRRALADGDLDQAFALGLMDAAPCPACAGECGAQLQQVQHDRRQALAARDRYRQREARLERRRMEREQRRMAASGSREASTATAAGGAREPTPALSGPAAPGARPVPALPAAAAAALARAQAKAAARAAGVAVSNGTPSTGEAKP